LLTKTLLSRFVALRQSAGLASAVSRQNRQTQLLWDSCQPCEAGSQIVSAVVAGTTHHALEVDPRPTQYRALDE
jgi:hypothetical protein